ncbi:MAG: hypothetical protein Ct9H90mP13_09700 [Pseudomonadota bacterium]|nr:MAG: hypothetical protein Ct9H90mP13_09700 [Pseudomonadota bacterium]
MFVPAIDRINGNLEVIHIGEGKDFRQSIIGEGIERIAIHTEDNIQRLAIYHECFNDDLERCESTIVVRNREIECIVRTMNWSGLGSIQYVGTKEVSKTTSILLINLKQL